MLSNLVRWETVVTVSETETMRSITSDRLDEAHEGDNVLSHGMEAS